VKHRETHVVSLGVFEKLVRAAGGHETQAKKKPFTYRGMLFFPGMSGLYQVTAAELVPLEQYRGKTFEDQFGSFSRPGFVKQLGSKRFVFADFHRFVLEGTHLAGPEVEIEVETRPAVQGSQSLLFAER